MQKKALIIASAMAGAVALCAGIFVVAQRIDNHNTAVVNKGTIKTSSMVTKTHVSSNPESSSETAVSSSSAVSQADYTPSSKHRIAYLTFDDGPSRITPRLLDILKENNVKATFFVVAEDGDTPQIRELMKREVSDGNTIGIHSLTHNYSYIYSSEDNFLTDFNKMRSIIINATGVTPEISRFPGGIGNTVNMRYNRVNMMPKLVGDVESMGVTPFDWNAGAIDASYPVPSKQQIVDTVVNQCRYLNNAVILLHDSDGHQTSVEAVPEIISKLRAMGFNFETLSPKSQIVREPYAVRRSTSSSKVSTKPATSSAAPKPSSSSSKPLVSSSQAAVSSSSSHTSVISSSGVSAT